MQICNLAISNCINTQWFDNLEQIKREFISCFFFIIYDRFIAITTCAVYEGCSLTIGTRRRHCPFGVQPIFVWYLTSIVGYCTLLFSINVLGYFTCLGMTLPIHGTNGFTWYPSHGRYTVFQCWEPGFYTLQILLHWSMFEPPTVAQPASVLPLSHTALYLMLMWILVWSRIMEGGVNFDMLSHTLKQD